VSRQNLTDRFIKSRENAPAGRRVDYPDAVVSGLALRVTDRGHKSFVLIARYPLQPKNPTRRALGDCYLPKKRRSCPRRGRDPQWRADARRGSQEGAGVAESDLAWH
jgi:hypothetical protein